ncbi:MAG: sigma factor-like helix-turn-helix DNA-binding protein, partial [Eubacteriales bacterium]
REREIIVMRYGLGRTPAVTQRVCAEKLGISRSYISRIEKAALAKLRKSL